MTTTKTFHFKGKVSWLLRKPNEWGNYAFNFYPADSDVRKEMRDTGFRNKLKEDDGKKSGVEGFFYTLKFPGQPKVYASDGGVFDGYIGNGSDVTVALKVETFESVKHGEVTRATVTGVRIDNLIEFVPETKTETSQDTGDDEIPF